MNGVAQGQAIARGIRAKARFLVLAEPATKETKAFEKAAAKIDKMIVALAEGAGDEAALGVAIERLDDRASKPEIRGRVDRELFFDRVSEIRRARTDAREIGRAARQAQREIEARTLRQAEREARPVPGTYLHELALLRGPR